MILFHSKIPIYEQYKLQFGDKPSSKVRQFFDEIEIPIMKL